jgi:hypothetical protein
MPCLALKENFQDYDTSDFTIVGVAPQTTIYTAPSTGDVTYRMYSNSNIGVSYIKNTDPIIFTYSAFDTQSIGGNTRFIRWYLLDHNSNSIVFWDISTPLSETRYEMQIIEGTAYGYTDGISTINLGSVSTNPSYSYIQMMTVGGNTDNLAFVDNIVIGETDHHITGALPTTWAIQRDLINPSATGVYSWSGTAWVLKNSNNFYVDADKEGRTAETLSIRHSGGTVIKSNSLTATHNQVTYGVTDFLNTATAVGTTVPDGQYSVSWDTMSPPNWFADTFWVMSNGGTVSWNADEYAQGDTATVTYAMTPTYFLPATYTYALVIQDMYGVTKETIPINQVSGTESVTLSAETYPAMVYNVLLQAIKISDSSTYIMNFDAMEMTGYIHFTGFVLNAETALPISGASINVTQGTTYQLSSSLASGAWNSTGNFLTGTTIRVNATKTGYDPYYNSFIPQIAKTINLTIPMLPTSKTCTGVCVGGVVNESVYGNPIPGATYHVRNGTELTATTNAAGYARVDSLTYGVLYDVWSTKVGYNTSLITNKLAVGV